MAEDLKIKDVLQGMLNSLKNAAQDISSIDVLTVTGSLSNAFKTTGSKKEMKNITEVMKDLSGTTGGSSGDLKLVCLTHVDFDQDTVQFVRENESLDSGLVKLHQESVKTAIETRNSMLSFIGSFFNSNM